MRQRVLEKFDATRLQHHQCSPYIKVTAEIIFKLLNEVSGRYKGESTKLLRHLEIHRWYVHMTAHEGGSNANAPLHITLMAPRGIHLNCKRKADQTLYVYEITWS